MIRTTINGYPIIYQSDNTYSMPNYTGTVQWNGNVKKFQVSTGSGWSDIDNNVSYNVDSRMQTLIEWAERKMREEMERAKLAKSNPTIKDLIEQIEEKEDQLLSVITLLREETKVGTS